MAQLIVRSVPVERDERGGSMEVEVLRGEGDVRTGGGLEPAGVFILAELTLS